MYGARQSTVVKNTLLELLGKGESRVPRVLSLLTYHFAGMEEGWALLREAGKKRIIMEVVAEETLLQQVGVARLAAECHHDALYPESFLTEESLGRTDCVLIPVLSFSFVSDLLRFNEQRNVVRFTLQALLSGKKVIALSCGANPFHPVFANRKLDRGTIHLTDELYKQMIQLKRMGIKVESSEKSVLSCMEEKNKNAVITETDVLKALKMGKRSIFAAKHDIITPLAWDAAKQHNLTITRK
ncbi:hypothetical protein [Fictibacillus fluitans]|uniref:Flavoprotein domain-containing protein n=1 Tax=Fictibacillus fluitans TaxID=3058422 RepID=A0ABT8HSV3_9BACL|nr:hypothetical protein [Fictibacillus sp. NE201]MDN4523851.1 hypothetical protein [Fictibacillus sp. NE201]